VRGRRKRFSFQGRLARVEATRIAAPIRGTKKGRESRVESGESRFNP